MLVANHLACMLPPAADPRLTRFKASEVAAASLVVGVHSTCPESLASSVQATLLARFSKVGMPGRAMCCPGRQDCCPYCMYCSGRLTQQL
jgi:hypothetical protein